MRDERLVTQIFNDFRMLEGPSWPLLERFLARKWSICPGRLGLCCRNHLVESAAALQRRYATYNSEGASIHIQNGLPVVSVPLPSRKDTCQFTLRPLSETASDFLFSLQDEDGGIERAALYTTEGSKIAGSTGIDLLMQQDFDLIINETRYRVAVPAELKLPLDGVQGLDEVKNMIHKLYTSLNIDQHQLNKKRELEGQIADLKTDLTPLDKQLEDMLSTSRRHTNTLLWLGLGAMGVQFGCFARLTWFEYSWDIMEPVTYFATYGTLMLFYCYFLLTRQEYTYPDAEERIQLFRLHKVARKKSFDIEKYNHMKETLAKVEAELKRLHDPLQLNLPTLPRRPLSEE